jgi:hypothetical protein
VFGLKGMYAMEKLPVYSLNKKKGNLAADYLKRVISNFAVVNIIDESVDLGIDMRAELLKETSPIGLFFNIQSKGKDEVDSETEKQGYFTVPIKISTINYWRQQNDVTILFVVDNVMGKCYWCNPLEQIADKISSIQSQDTVTIRVYLNKYIDLSSQECPSSIRQDIMLYMVNQVEHINEKLEKIKKELILGSKVNTKTSIELLKRITKTASQTVGTYESVCEVLIDNIKKQFSEAYNYACELEVLDAMIVKKWCKSGVFEEKGFTRSKKSLRDLQKEIDELINKYENDKENLDLLEQLQTYDYEVEDLLKNIGAFLYEMACEDSPFGDHTELYHKTVEREWKYN